MAASRKDTSTRDLDGLQTRWGVHTAEIITMMPPGGEVPFAQLYCVLHRLLMERHPDAHKLFKTLSQSQFTAGPRGRIAGSCQSPYSVWHTKNSHVLRGLKATGMLTMRVRHMAKSMWRQQELLKRQGGGLARD